MQPRTWPDGLEYRSAWRRFITISNFASTSGSALGCMLACGIVYSAATDVPPIVRAYTPEGYLSFAFMALLIVSEFAQDFLAELVLIDECCVGRRWRVLSTDAKALLRSKLLPPIFRSKADMGSVLLPLFASGSLFPGVAFLMANLQVYEIEQNRTGR